MSSVVERWENSLALLVAENRAILKNKYHHYRVLDGRSEYVQVGRGQKTSVDCGSWHRKGYYCDNLVGHVGKFLDGVDATGKVVFRLSHWFCQSPFCPKCFLRGYSVVRSKSATARIDTAVKRGFGKPLHVVISPPKELHGLRDVELIRLCVDAFERRGGVCGGSVFHGRRIDRVKKGLDWSPHVHFVGFLKEDYDRCRNCENRVCLRDASGERFDRCDGFEAVTRREFKKDGFIVKVEHERKSVFGTFWYQINHSTVRLGIKRPYSVRWWGKLSNRNFKTCFVLPKEVDCPLCREEMKEGFYRGEERVVSDLGDERYKPLVLLSPFNSDGSASVVEVFDVGG